MNRPNSRATVAALLCGLVLIGVSCGGDETTIVPGLAAPGGMVPIVGARPTYTVDVETGDSLRVTFAASGDKLCPDSA